MTTPNEPTRPYESHDNSGEPDAAAPYAAQQPTSRPSAISRHRTAILTGVIGLIIGGVVGGLIGWGATDNSSHSSTSAPVAAPAHHKSAKPAHHGVRGSITAISGDSWTVRSPKGAGVTVTINSSTAFGTAKKPQQASDFAVGDNIVVVGTRNGSTVTATRVAKATTHANQPTAPTSQPG